MNVQINSVNEIGAFLKTVFNHYEFFSKSELPAERAYATSLSTFISEIGHYSDSIGLFSEDGLIRNKEEIMPDFISVLLLENEQSYFSKHDDDDEGTLEYYFDEQSNEIPMIAEDYDSVKGEFPNNTKSITALYALCNKLCAGVPFLANSIDEYSASDALHTLNNALPTHAVKLSLNSISTQSIQDKTYSDLVSIFAMGHKQLGIDKACEQIPSISNFTGNNKAGVASFVTSGKDVFFDVLSHYFLDSANHEKALSNISNSNESDVRNDDAFLRPAGSSIITKDSINFFLKTVNDMNHHIQGLSDDQFINYDPGTIGAEFQKDFKKQINAAVSIINRSAIEKTDIYIKFYERENATPDLAVEMA